MALTEWEARRPPGTNEAPFFIRPGPTGQRREIDIAMGRPLTRRIERRQGLGDPGAQVVAGVGLGWVVLPFLVLGDALARHLSGPESLAPAFVDGIVGILVGLLLGVSRLGWLGLAGVFGGVVSGAALPYLLVPMLLGVGTPVLEAYAKYAPGMASAAIAATVAMVAAGRSSRRITVRPVPLFVVGLVMFALWLFVFFLLATAPRSADAGHDWRSMPEARHSDAVIRPAWPRLWRGLGTTLPPQWGSLG